MEKADQTAWTMHDFKVSAFVFRMVLGTSSDCLTRPNSFVLSDLIDEKVTIRNAHTRIGRPAFVVYKNFRRIQPNRRSIFPNRHHGVFVFVTFPSFQTY